MPLVLLGSIIMDRCSFKPFNCGRGHFFDLFLLVHLSLGCFICSGCIWAIIWVAHKFSFCFCFNPRFPFPPSIRHKKTKTKKKVARLVFCPSLLLEPSMVDSLGGHRRSNPPIVSQFFKRLGLIVVHESLCLFAHR